MVDGGNLELFCFHFDHHFYNCIHHTERNRKTQHSLGNDTKVFVIRSRDEHVHLQKKTYMCMELVWISFFKLTFHFTFSLKHNQRFDQYKHYQISAIPDCAQKKTHSLHKLFIFPQNTVEWNLTIYKCIEVAKWKHFDHINCKSFVTFSFFQCCVCVQRN